MELTKQLLLGTKELEGMEVDVSAGGAATGGWVLGAHRVG